MNDTINLLKECDAGLEMAISSLEQVKDEAKADNFTNMLDKYYNNHIKIQKDIDKKLVEYNSDGKKANPFAEVMSTMKTSFKLTTANHTDEQIADLMIDGCNMGIKSVSKYMNKYTNANQEIMQLANDIIVLEQNFSNELRQYL